MSTFRERHKCRKILDFTWTMDGGREWWLGELTEPDPEYPHETHCLHIKTPENDVVLGVMGGDAAILTAMMQVVHGMPVNQTWLDRMTKKAKLKAKEL